MTLRIVCALFSAVCVAVPFLSVEYAPILDLPPQVAQFRLLEEHLADPAGSPYIVQWFSPYLLSYTVLGAAYALFPPLAAGRIAMLALGLAWVAAIHGLAWHLRRPPVAAVLASVFFFNHFMYWGFYSFTVGLPVFCCYYLLLTNIEALEDQGRAPGFTRWWGLAFLVILLYYSHILWLFGAGVWLGVTVVQRRRLNLRLAAAHVPALVCGAAWLAAYATTRSLTFGQGLTLRWLTWAEKLDPAGWLEAALGGLTGPAEPILLAFTLIYIVAGFVRHGADRHRGLCLLALVFFGLAAVLPTGGRATIKMDSRWVPVALVFLLLATPAVFPRPHRGRLPVTVLGLIVAGVFSLWTARTWLKVEQEEFSGLTEALAAVPERARLLGLSLAQSRYMRGERSIFIQTVAYAELLKKAELNQSFAEFPQVLVRYRTERLIPWTRGLEHNPTSVTANDFLYFTHVLVSGPEAVHAYVAGRGYLRPLNDRGVWRLYAIVSYPGQAAQCGNPMPALVGQPGLPLAIPGRLCF